MDEENFDAESSRLQIKKLKEKVKSLVSEVDLSREIRSVDFPKASKLQLERIIGDNSSELETIDEDGDEFLDIREADFVNEANWLIDWNSNCNVSGQPSDDIFNALYCEAEECDADMGDLYCELQLLRNSSSSVETKGSNRSALIDSRTFTRPKKYVSRPPLTSIISNCGDDGRRVNLQRRMTNTVIPTQSVLNKLEDLKRVNNRAVSRMFGEDNNWEEGSQEGLADIENSSVKNQRKSLPASIIDRLQELKRSNNSYVSSRTPETGRHLNVVNGNMDDSEAINMAEDARKVKAAFDLNVKNALSTSCASDILKNIPEYFSDNDNESFFSLDEVSGFCDRLTLSTDPITYSSIVREMEQNEICFYHGGNPPEDAPPSRMTFGGMEIPMNNDMQKGDLNSSQQQLSEADVGLNKTYEVLYDESTPKGIATFEVKKRESHLESSDTSRYGATEKKPNLVDVILQSDIIKNLNSNYANKYCDNRNGNGSNGERLANSAGNNFNETYTQNELNKFHSEKYTTKIFDASFKKPSPSDKSNGKKDSDHSEDDCMSTTSDNSYRSVDSNSELKNIEELKNIALQQNRKLTEVKFSTPKLQNSKGSLSVNSDEWRNVSPIRKDVADVESQGSSNSSSRGQSPRRAFLPSGSESSRKTRPFSLRQPPKVPQRELKLKPALIRPLQNFKKTVNVNSGRTQAESATAPKDECKASVSTAGIPVVKQSVIPITAVSSTTSTRPVTRIPSGIPRPPSRLKQPQIRASEAYKK